MRVGERLQTAASDLIGAGYEIVERVGSGGMGTVYRAIHQETGRVVAIKLMRPDLSPRRAKRLWREAVAGARLEHPNICKVIDVGTTVENQPFLVMELLEGQSLADALGKNAGLSVARSLSIAQDMLAGVGAAHALGILHRDLKPGNIFLAQENGQEVIKLVDFGVCLPQNEDVTRITRIGGMVGTIRYMSPEQLRGLREIGPPADLFSVGVVLYRMLTGAMPFKAKSREELLKRILKHEMTPLTEYRMDIPSTVMSVVKKSLHPDPNHRFANSDEFVEALRTCERMRSSEVLVGSDTPEPGTLQAQRPLSERVTARSLPAQMPPVVTPTFDPFEVRVGKAPFQASQPVITPSHVSTSDATGASLDIEAPLSLVPDGSGERSELDALVQATKPPLRLVTPLEDRSSSSSVVDPQEIAQTFKRPQVTPVVPAFYDDVVFESSPSEVPLVRIEEDDETSPRKRGFLTATLALFGLIGVGVGVYFLVGLNKKDSTEANPAVVELPVAAERPAQDGDGASIPQRLSKQSFEPGSEALSKQAAQRELFIPSSSNSEVDSSPKTLKDEPMNQETRDAIKALEQELAKEGAKQKPFIRQPSDESKNPSTISSKPRNSLKPKIKRNKNRSSRPKTSSKKQEPKKASEDIYIESPY